MIHVCLNLPRMEVVANWDQTYLTSFQRDALPVEIKLLNIANLYQVSSYNNHHSNYQLPTYKMKSDIIPT